MRPQTYIAFPFRAEREKLREAATERMRQRWASKPKTETKPPQKKVAKRAGSHSN